VGVGHKETAGDGRQRTPRWKIRRRFRGYKHTSLISLNGAEGSVSSLVRNRGQWLHLAIKCSLVRPVRPSARPRDV
jgi:hypothetical protein